MHSYDIHKAFYLDFKIHGSWPVLGQDLRTNWVGSISILLNQINRLEFLPLIPINQKKICLKYFKHCSETVAK